MTACNHDWEIIDHSSNFILTRCKLCNTQKEAHLEDTGTGQKSLTLMNSTNFIIPYSEEMLKHIADFKEEIYQYYKAISHETTPLLDGDGRKVIKKRPDNKDYIDDAWMTDRLNKHFPGWSWEMAAPLHFLGAEWVVAQGHLCIIDEHLLVFNINPPIRRYYAVDAVRIQYKQGQPHTPENIIDVGDNCQSADTGAKKRAINRLCGIGDDIYGKRVEEDGAGTMEEVLAGSPTISIDNKVTMFNQWLSDNSILISQACEVLDVKKMSEIADFERATKILIAWKLAGKPKGDDLFIWKESQGEKVNAEKV